MMLKVHLEFQQPGYLSLEHCPWGIPHKELMQFLWKSQSEYRPFVFYCWIIFRKSINFKTWPIFFRLCQKGRTLEPSFAHQELVCFNATGRFVSWAETPRTISPLTGLRSISDFPHSVSNIGLKSCLIVDVLQRYLRISPKEQSRNGHIYLL